MYALVLTTMFLAGGASQDSGGPPAGGPPPVPGAQTGIPGIRSGVNLGSPAYAAYGCHGCYGCWGCNGGHGCYGVSGCWGCNGCYGVYYGAYRGHSAYTGCFGYYQPGGGYLGGFAGGGYGGGGYGYGGYGGGSGYAGYGYSGFGLYGLYGFGVVPGIRGSALTPFDAGRDYPGPQVINLVGPPNQGPPAAPLVPLAPRMPRATAMIRAAGAEEPALPPRAPEIPTMAQAVPGARPAILVIRAPEGTGLTVNDGHPISLRSTQETFLTPILAPGLRYTYVFRADIGKKEGKVVSQEQRISFRAGERVEVDFREAAVAPITGVARVTVLGAGKARLKLNAVTVGTVEERRSFETPKLEVGRRYAYTMTAELDDGSGPRSVTREVVVEAGKAVTVDFRDLAVVAR